MACAQFDGQVVRRDPEIRELLDRFVGVRIVQGNGMDLSLFQFDYDMSFAVFFLNADRTIYGRYGSRSHLPDEAHLDISMTGLAEAMKAVLALHAQYPANRDSLRAKTGPAPPYPVPEKMPGLMGKYRSELREGSPEAISQSCIHCHQIPVARMASHIRKREPMPSRLAFPWPMPEVIGLGLDRSRRATVKRVAPGSAAAKAGFRQGDDLRFLQGQPIISIADVQWVLHRAADTDTVAAEVLREGEQRRLTLTLEDGWRTKSDIGWRTSGWEYRRIALGGLRLEDVPEAERRKRGIADGAIALRVDYAGKFGKYGAARRAGFREDDVLISFDGRSRGWREQDLFFHVLKTKKKGDRIPVTILRGDREMELVITVQD